MSERFYVNLPLSPGPFTLDGAEAHHLASVCRLRPGDEVCLFNGDGCEYPARIRSVARRVVSLEILAATLLSRELSCQLEVAAPMPKGDRGQFLIEKLTELGVTAFVPLLCKRTNLHQREYKHDKLQRHVIEASKQCGRNVLMRIEEATDWETYCVRPGEGELRILADPKGINHRQVEVVANRPVRAAVGPEGGFTSEEIALSQEHDWQAVSLGPRMLRVETAALVLAAWFALGLA